MAHIPYGAFSASGPASCPSFLLPLSDCHILVALSQLSPSQHPITLLHDSLPFHFHQSIMKYKQFFSYIRVTVFQETFYEGMKYLNANVIHRKRLLQHITTFTVLLEHYCNPTNIHTNKFMSFALVRHNSFVNIYFQEFPIFYIKP